VQSVFWAIASYAQTMNVNEDGIATVGLPLQVFCWPMVLQNDLLTVMYVPLFVLDANRDVNRWALVWFVFEPRCGPACRAKVVWLGALTSAPQTTRSAVAATKARLKCHSLYFK
jgi:hypothetical protein